MAINVYWCCIEKEWMRAEEPVPVLNDFSKDNKYTESGILRCPAMRDEMTNTFSLRSIYDYEFTVSENDVSSHLYDQDFFNKHVVIRSIKERIFSFSQEIIFFTDEPSLMMSANLHPYLENNEITKRCISLPGKFDIGKWFRTVEYGFMLNRDSDQFKINMGDVYQYITFHTDEKIVFKQFYKTDKIQQMLYDTRDIRSNRKNFVLLDWFYKKFRFKNFVLKEIRENLI